MHRRFARLLSLAFAIAALANACRAAEARSAGAPGWRPAADAVYLQEVGRQAASSTPLSSAAVFDGQVYAGSDDGLAMLEGDRLTSIADRREPVRRLVAAPDALWAITADELVGNDLDNLLYGMAGDDTLVGAAGRDMLRGGDPDNGGDDLIYGMEDLDDYEVADAADNLSPLHPQHSESGGWTESTSAGFNGTQRFAAPNAGNTATWTFADLGDDPNPSMEVFVTWDPAAEADLPGSNLLATNANFKVYDAANVKIFDGSINLRVDPSGPQTDDDVKWQSLGQFSNLGSEIRVELEGNANGYLLADAVRIMQVPATLQPPMDLMIKFQPIPDPSIPQTFIPREQWPLVLEWKPPEGALELNYSGYEIQHSKTGLGDWQTLYGPADLPFSSVDATAETDLDQQPLPRGTQYFRIRSVSGTEVSDWTEPLDDNGNPVGDLDPLEQAAIKLNVSRRDNPQGDAYMRVEWQISRNALTQSVPPVYEVYRKKMGFNEKWKGPLATVTPTPYPEDPDDVDPLTDYSTVFWDDLDSQALDVFEYQVRQVVGRTSEAEMAATIERPVEVFENRGTIILVVAENIADVDEQNDAVTGGPLAYEISRLKWDLIGDGWQVKIIEAERNIADPQFVFADDNDSGVSVAAVKAKIVDAWDNGEAGVKSVLLIGDVPVPYSGAQAPDNHDELRSLPSDVFYGDMDGEVAADGDTSTAWTDQVDHNSNDDFVDNPAPYEYFQVPIRSVSNTVGDLRFDNETVPEDDHTQSVELQVGRIDFSRMPTFATDHSTLLLTEQENELALLRRYLDKDHAYRQRMFVVPETAQLVRGGNIHTRSGEWEKYSPIVGANEVLTGANGAPSPDWITNMGESSFASLFASGAGLGFTNRINVVTDIDQSLATTSFIAGQTTTTVFNALSGSYSVDWNVTNNFVRSFIANDGYSLASQWNPPENPGLLLQHMGIGESIGFANLVSQVGFEGDDSAATWRGLMGDPSLRAQVVAPPSGVTASSAGTGKVQVEWTRSPDDPNASNYDPSDASEQFLGYRIYKASSVDGLYAMAQDGGEDLGTVSGGPQDIDGNVNDVYLVRAIKLESTPSGSYENASQGAFNKTPFTTVAALNYGSAQSVDQFVGTSNDVAQSGIDIEANDGSVTIGTPLDIFKSAAVVNGGAFNEEIGGLTIGKNYVVRLYFSDLSSEATPALNLSPFDVSLEGVSLLDDYDLEGALDEDGSPYAGIVKTFEVTVDADGELDLSITPGSGDALISAIEVIAIS